MTEALFDPESLGAFSTSPGVYIMKNAAGEVLYIGKAANLRSRVRNYFTRSGDNRFSVEFLRRHVTHVETVVTPSEKEAFLLENTLIKQHKPRYNIRLRDDKTYISLRLRMNHEYPCLEQVRVRRLSEIPRRGKDLYFGPYTSAGAVRDTLRFVLKVFPVRTCKDSVFRNRTRPCILFDVGKCVGPCTEPVTREEYAGLVANVARFLEGKDEDVRRMLEEKMLALAEDLEFEKAALIRDRIASLDRTLEKQQAAVLERLDRDVIAVASQQGRSLVVLQEYRGGALVHTQEYYIRNYEQPDAEVLYSFISQHYHGGVGIPHEVLVGTEPQDCGLLQEWLREQRGGQVELSVPQRGDRSRMMHTAHINARQSLSRRLSGERNEQETLEELQRKLGLQFPPRSIECVDISNIMGVLAVGSLVRFEDAVPEKSGYRLYRIKTVEGSNDFAMMREVLTRRFRRDQVGAVNDPDLLLVDGGKGQLGIAVQVFEELGIRNVALAAIAKSRLKVKPAGIEEEKVRFRTEERIFLPGRKNPVTFPHNSPALFLVQRVRDETHRFAITYHRKLREKTNRRSVLDEIPGVGPKRKRTLLRRFGSLTAVREASREEIAAVPGISRDAAENVYRFLHAEHETATPNLLAEESDEIIQEQTEDAEISIEDIAAE